MKTITLEELLEAGCHFGHQINRKNPRASEFIYETRANVDIINLEDTQAGLTSAASYLKKVAEDGGTAILVGTKRQAQNIIREEALRARGAGSHNLYFVSSRWIGGTLTNFSEVSKNFKRLAELTELLEKRDPRYTKWELSQFARERDKLKNFYEGIADMSELPNVLVVIDTKHENTAVEEAHKTGVPVVGVVDTNADPGAVDHAIPSNDDAVGAVKLLTSCLVDAWIEGEGVYLRKEEKAEKARVQENARLADEARKAAEKNEVESKQTSEKSTTGKSK